METKFYEMLKNCPQLGSGYLVSYGETFKELLDKELEIHRYVLIPGSKVCELILHKLELEREILKARLEEYYEKYNNPSPPLTSEEIPKIRIVRRLPAPNS
jgi:hypothetical protein